MLEQLYVQQGDVKWSEQPCCFKTVLGSCVSVCLWDPNLGIGGLNHFVLPRAGLQDRNNPRFGDVAIPRLIQGLQALGTRGLVAKVFGGARVAPAGGRGTVGAANTEIAMQLLHQYRIPVTAQRTGGTQGIALHFFPDSGEVLVRELAAAPATKQATRVRRRVRLPASLDAGLAPVWSSAV